jgi:hypothetical protein
LPPTSTSEAADHHAGHAGHGAAGHAGHTGGEHARPVLACGRLGEHTPHTWLTRDDLWCPGTGEPGRTAPPDPDAAEKQNKKKQKRVGDG